ncbi:hypothetical protein SVI_1257 [Shewanella violacea DSS12]|uniref:Uncharacterized protein n=1 Tax=Shewanella violacea (strain JCM 10179 / CIP 106290 / LMG 19151 / DSS12) TaxID=637905 RepID=D4ZHS9_SHEVD|nr:hypothetical protein SVI_1257 [Shewanella violacea DSS12]
MHGTFLALFWKLAAVSALVGLQDSLTLIAMSILYFLAIG